MKFRVLPALALLSSVASVAFGSTNVTYTASADPNAVPDANNNTVDAWTLSRGGDTAGQSVTYSGSYYTTNGPCAAAAVAGVPVREAGLRQRGVNPLAFARYWSSLVGGEPGR